MKDIKNILGQSIELTGESAVWMLESAISEGFFGGAISGEKEALNIFGRMVSYFSPSQLSTMAGLAASGLRVGAFVGGDEMAQDHLLLSWLTRQHLSTVIYVSSSENGQSLNPGNADVHAGCFRFLASNVQEAVDFGIISHKIAEQSLVPGIVLLDGFASAFSEQSANFPSRDELIQFIGNPDDPILSPTPSQHMIFGKHRRRVFNWFNFDHPTLNGAWKDPELKGFEAAAQQQFFHRHLPEIIRKVMAEYSEMTGRQYAPVETYETKKADFLILTHGAAFHVVKTAIDELPSGRKKKVGCLKLNTVNPFPVEQLKNLFNGKKGIAVLENVHGPNKNSAPFFNKIQTTLPEKEKRGQALYSALFGGAISTKNIIDIIQNMMPGGEGKEQFYINIDFTRAASSFPKQEVLLQTIKREYPGIEEETLMSRKATESPEISPTGIEENQPSPGLPHLVKRYKDLGPPYSRLSRFYDNTGHFFQSEKREELVADPFQAIPVVPPATAHFSPIAGKRETIPVFKPEKCTGCGDCFVACPHSAIPPLALSPENLIRGAMEIAAQRGTPVSGLTPMVKNLERIALKILKEEHEELNKVARFLPTAFERLTNQMKLADVKLEKTKQEFEIILDVLADYPIAVTDHFFHNREASEKNSGELFSLAIDPHACTACGLCVEICPENALELNPQTPELLAEVHNTFSLWEQLPDTGSETVSHFLADENYSSFAAVLLSRDNYLSMSGGGLSESGAGSKTMMHLLTATAESIYKSKTIDQGEKVRELIKSLSENIHEGLSESLPKDNFEALAEVMKDASESRLSFDDLIGKLSDKEHLKLIDAATLQRKLDLLGDLKELFWNLTAGPGGTGRAKYGLALDTSSMPWAGQYPYNSFTSPVLIQWDGTLPSIAEGLLHGHLRHTLDHIKILRRAKLEAKNKYRPKIHDRIIAGLNWGELEDDEKAWLPPILVVGGKNMLSDKNHSQLISLLGGGLPIKIIILDDGRLPAYTGEAGNVLSLSESALISAIAFRKAYVFRGSMGDSEYLFNGLTEGLNSEHPALFYLFSPEKWSAEDRDLALNTRACPFVKFNPNSTDGFLSTSIRLEANPSVHKDWHTIKMKNGGSEEEENGSKYTLTFADWLHRQEEWSAHFEPYRKKEGVALPVADYLDLDEKARAEKVPVVKIRETSGQWGQRKVSEEVIELNERVRTHWNSLREIAGLLTPFPQKLKEQVEKELTDKYERSMSELKAEYEEKLKNKEQELMNDVRIKLRNKLLALSKQGGQN